MALSIIALMASCVQDHPRHRKNTTKVHSYQAPDYTTSDVNDFLFWYIILNNDGGCYAYSSATPVTDFSSARFSYYATAPQMPAEAKELPEQEVETEQFSEEMQSELDVENGEGASEDVADDGVSDDGGTDSDGGDSGSDGGGDSGGGDSGGGDSGGGDGGGGGD